MIAVLWTYEYVYRSGENQNGGLKIVREVEKWKVEKPNWVNWELGFEIKYKTKFTIGAEERKRDRDRERERER